MYEEGADGIWVGWVVGKERSERGIRYKEDILNWKEAAERKPERCWKQAVGSRRRGMFRLHFGQEAESKHL